MTSPSSSPSSIAVLLFGEKVTNDYVSVFAECPRCEQMVVRSQMPYHNSIYHGEEK